MLLFDYPYCKSRKIMAEAVCFYFAVFCDECLPLAELIALNSKKVFLEVILAPRH
jgi:hypothetical protein